MADSALQQLGRLGQSVWLAFVRRDILAQDTFTRWVKAGEISGVLLNLSAFDKELRLTDSYGSAILGILGDEPGVTVDQLFEYLAVEDVHHAADLLRPVYDRTEGRDGFVNLDLSPKMAYDALGTVEQARHLWKKVNRPNVMIKVPATREGLPAIRTLIKDGINVNATLIFSLSQYEAAVDAFLSGLELRYKTSPNASPPASVASFLVSRVDSIVDSLLPAGSHLRGTIAIANAKLAYERFRRDFHASRFRSLAEHGARMQRLLWGSTGSKNPEYDDIHYVRALIGADTVSAMPPHTLEAFRARGRPAITVIDDLDDAEERIRELGALGIDLDAISEQLQEYGIEAQATAYDTLLTSLATKRDQAISPSAS